MKQNIFLPADILIPDTDMCRWSVVACDQFTSEPDYWARVDKFVGASPSSLRLMLPEVYLGSGDIEKRETDIHGAMNNYLTSGVFRRIESSYIYTKRKLTSGKTRRGIIGKLDLEAYDYSPESDTPVHSTESTVADRLPPRVALRSASPIEMPHVVVFIDDPDGKVINDSLSSGEILYDFDLMEDGGHITGWRIDTDSAIQFDSALAELTDPKIISEKYGIGSNLAFAVGDGNHSLAAAKLCWENIRETLNAEQQTYHPARYALIELVNLYDESVEFEPIHRVIFDTDNSSFISRASEYFSPAAESKSQRNVCCTCGSEAKQFELPDADIRSIIAQADDFMNAYISQYGGKIDYIHGENTASKMSAEGGCAGLLLPALDKRELFPSLVSGGTMPRKSFSVGHANDKRYYLECRKIVTD